MPEETNVIESTAEPVENPSVENSEKNSTETNPFIFQLTLENDESISFKNGSKEDYPIQEVMGVVMHFIYGGSKQVMEKLYEEHPELTPEQKEEEMYNILVFNVVTTQMLMFNVLTNLFGKFDQKKFEEKMEYARTKQEEFVLSQVDKAEELQKKISKKVKK